MTSKDVLHMESKCIQEIKLLLDKKKVVRVYRI